MSKNKLVRAVVMLVLSGVGALAFAQTPAGPPGAFGPAITSVDELLRSGQLGRPGGGREQADGRGPSGPAGPASVAGMPPPLGMPMPSPLPVPPVASAQASAAPNAELMLLAVYMAAGVRTAHFRAGDVVQIAAVGDRIKGGWSIDAISAQSVFVKRCTNGKCTDKTFHLGDD